MKTQTVFIITIFASYLSSVEAQRKGTKEPLQTGTERKLGVVYKTGDKR